jgi:hypothetical protein
MATKEGRYCIGLLSGMVKSGVHVGFTCVGFAPNTCPIRADSHPITRTSFALFFPLRACDESGSPPIRCMSFGLLACDVVRRTYCLTLARGQVSINAHTMIAALRITVAGESDSAGTKSTFRIVMSIPSF